MKYVKAFDGIRGWGMVMLFAFHPGYIPGVWPMIQLFFGLSGYLISKILLEDSDSPFKGYMTRYFWRRTLRIFPIYFVVISAAAVIYAATGAPEEFGNEWPYLFTYTLNFARLRSSDVGEYFVHFWSLALEEQFYLFWPLVIYFVPKPLFKKLVIGLMIVSPFIRLATYMALDGDNNLLLAGRSIYVLPFTQLDAFAVGSAIAVFKLEDMKHVRKGITLSLGAYFGAGFLMLCYTHFFVKGANPWTFGYPMFMIRHHQYLWGYSLINILSFFTILSVLQRLWFARLVFEWEPFIRLGRISYGCYIYHLPIMRFFQIGFEYVGLPLKGVLPNLLFFVSYSGATILVAWLSFRFIEVPFLKLKTKFQPLPKAPEVAGQRSAADAQAPAKTATG